MNIFFALIIIAAMCFILASAEILFSNVMYLIYIYNGGTKTYKWYKNFMKNHTVKW